MFNDQGDRLNEGIKCNDVTLYEVINVQNVIQVGLLSFQIILENNLKPEPKLEIRKKIHKTIKHHLPKNNKSLFTVKVPATTDSYNSISVLKFNLQSTSAGL